MPTLRVKYQSNHLACKQEGCMNNSSYVLGLTINDITLSIGICEQCFSSIPWGKSVFIECINELEGVQPK